MSSFIEDLRYRSNKNNISDTFHDIDIYLKHEKRIIKIKNEMLEASNKGFFNIITTFENEEEMKDVEKYFLPFGFEIMRCLKGDFSLLFEWRRK